MSVTAGRTAIPTAGKTVEPVQFQRGIDDTLHLPLGIQEGLCNDQDRFLHKTPDLE